MTTRYFKVLHKSGAFIDGIYYPPADQVPDVSEAIVPLENVAKGKEPLWGVEVDIHGNEIGEVPAGVMDKMSDALAAKIAAGAGEKPAAPDADKTEPATGEKKEAEARKQVILDTLQLLDHSDDSHWTGEGLPSVKIVSDTAGIEVTRKEITAAAPDFVRQAA